MRKIISFFVLLSFPFGWVMTFNIAFSTKLACEFFPISCRPLIAPSIVELVLFLFVLSYAPLLSFFSWSTLGARTLYHIGVESFSLQVLGGVFFPIGFLYALKCDPRLALQSFAEELLEYINWNSVFTIQSTIISSAILTFTLLLSMSLPVNAQSSIIFGLRPDDATKGYFEFSAKPGDVIKDAVLVVNDSEQPLSLNVTLADGQTNSTGGTGFSEKSDKAKQWIAAPDLGLMQIGGRENGQPKAARIVFSLNIPKDAAPGEYLFGFVASPTTTSVTAQKGFVVNVVQRSAVSVIVRGTGGDAIPKMQIESVSPSATNEQWHLQIALRNAGNVRWNGGEGTVTLTNENGEKTVLPFQVGIVWGGDSIVYPLYVTAPKPGNYQVDVKLGEANKSAAVTIQNGGLLIPTPAPQSVAAATQGIVALAATPAHIEDTPTPIDFRLFAVLGATLGILLISLVVGVLVYRKL